jgi:hypothetical protein
MFGNPLRSRFCSDPLAGCKIRNPGTKDAQDFAPGKLKCYESLKHRNGIRAKNPRTKSARVASGSLLGGGILAHDGFNAFVDTYLLIPTCIYFLAL